MGVGTENGGQGQHADDFDLRIATTDDAEAVLALARAFWSEDGFPSTPRQEEGVRTLLANSGYGEIRLIEIDGRPIGYIAVCWGYSIEFGGRDAFIDEFFVVPEARGRGLGARVLNRLADELAAAGIFAMHLEVMPDNIRVAPLYRRNGFSERGRLLSRHIR